MKSRAQMYLLLRKFATPGLLRRIAVELEKTAKFLTENGEKEEARGYYENILRHPEHLDSSFIEKIKKIIATPKPEVVPNTNDLTNKNKIYLKNYPNIIAHILSIRFTEEIRLRNGRSIVFPETTQGMKELLAAECNEISGECTVFLKKLRIKEGNNFVIVPINPIPLHMQQGNNVFNFLENDQLKEELRKAIMSQGLLSEKRDIPIEFKPADDRSLQELRIDIQKQGLSFKGENIYSMKYPVPFLLPSVPSLKKIKIEKNHNGSIHITFVREKLKPRGAPEITLQERYKLVGGNNKFFLQLTEDQLGLPSIPSPLNSTSEKYIQQFFTEQIGLSTMGLGFVQAYTFPYLNQLLSGLPRPLRIDRAIKMAKVLLHLGVELMKKERNNAESVIGESKFNKRIQRIAKIVTQTGGTALIDLLDMNNESDGLTHDLVDVLSVSDARTDSYIDFWNFAKNNPQIEGFDTKNLGTYMGIKFLSGAKNAKTIIAELLKTKKIHLLRDRNTLSLMIYHHHRLHGQQTSANLFRMVENMTKRAYSIDPLKPKPKQKIRFIVLNDESVTKAQKHFYMRQTFTHLYGEKAIAGYHIQTVKGLTSLHDPSPTNLNVSLIEQQIHTAFQGDEKLFLYVNAHGLKGLNGKTSLGDIAGMIISALLKLGNTERVKKFIRNNLIIGTNQCHGRDLIDAIQKKFSVDPLAMFAQTTRSSTNINYLFPSHKMTIASNFERALYDKTIEFLKNQKETGRGYWVRFDGEKIYAKPHLISIMHHVEQTDPTLDLQVFLNTPEFNNAFDPKRGLQIVQKQKKAKREKSLA